MPEFVEFLVELTPSSTFFQRVARIFFLSFLLVPTGAAAAASPLCYTANFPAIISMNNLRAQNTSFRAKNWFFSRSRCWVTSSAGNKWRVSNSYYSNV